MVAWMDDEALHRTLTTGRATYWSRSRQEYWVKGETSGQRPEGARGAAGLRRRRAARDRRPDRARRATPAPAPASTPTSCSPSVPDPLAETAARLRALVPAFPDTYDVVLGEASGPGWFRLDAAPVARLVRRGAGAGQPAAARLGGRGGRRRGAGARRAGPGDGRARRRQARLGPRRADGAPRAGGAPRPGGRPPACVGGGGRPGRPRRAEARLRAARARRRRRAPAAGAAGAAGARRVGVDAPAARARRDAGTHVPATRPRCSTPSPPRPSRRWPRCWTRCAPPPGSGSCRSGTRRVTPCASPPRWRRATRGGPRGRASATALLDALVAHGAPIRGRGDRPAAARTSRAGARAGRLLPRLPHRPAGRRPLRRPVHHLPPAGRPRSAPRRYAAWLDSAPRSGSGPVR